MSELEQELTTEDLIIMFGVSKTTIYAWRKKGLKHYELSGNGLLNPVRYALQEVKKFAEENGKEIINDIYAY